MYQFPEELKTAYESSPLSFVYYENINGAAVPVLVSQGFCQNTGADRETALQWLRTDLFAHIHPNDVRLLKRISDGFLNHGGDYDIVFRSKINPDAQDDTPSEESEVYAHIHAIGKWQTMPDGTELAVITYANLSQTKKTVNEKTDILNLFRKDHFYTDPLTGLPNLNYLHAFGNETISAIRAAGQTPCLVYCNFRSMQFYNNRYGFSAGDQLLCLAAETLTKLFEDSLVVRTTDDRFLVITRMETQEQLKRQLREANAAIRAAAIGNTGGVYAGVCLLNDADVSLYTALDHAKYALKQIKKDRSRYVSFYSQKSNDLYYQERYILENFDQAMEQGYIKPYYHALYRIKSKKIAAFEALARWRDPVQGMILPNVFIPILQKYHLLYKLDLHLFEEVCREVKTRFDNGLPLVPVSVNFSAQDFDYTDIVEEMNRLFEQYNLAGLVDKGYFIVEITEQDLALGTQTLQKQLAAIRSNGYRLWLDDFGSGYSSINRLSQFSFDLIKFDMQLLRNLDENDGMNRIILRELVRLSRRFGIHTLIEGVETEEQLAFTEEIGCELAQGFYFHKPESLDEILYRIRNGDLAKQCETPTERAAFNRAWFA